MAGAGAASAVATQGDGAGEGSAADETAGAGERAPAAGGPAGVPELDADAIAAACREAPDSLVVEVIEQQGGAAD